MILNHKVFGSSNNKIIILHGLLGSLDNWVTVAKNLASHGFEIILIDQRNHGKSFHADQFDYETMSEDLKKFLDEKKIQKVSLIGHSMGGNAAIRGADFFGKEALTTTIPAQFSKKFDIIFIDPPYKEIKINMLIEKIIYRKLLKKNGILIIHRHKKDKIVITKKINILDTRTYGVSKVYFAN